MTAPIVQTQSGLYIDLRDVRPEYIRLPDIAHALAYTCRFNGHTRRYYSVAQHSLLVASLVPPEHRLEALLHDAAEAYIGDITTPLKTLLTGVHAIEQQIDRAIRRKYNLPETITPIVKTADRVALATERRDLMPTDDTPWEILDGITPSAQRIQPIAPDAAHSAYLSALIIATHCRNNTETTA